MRGVVRPRDCPCDVARKPVRCSLAEVIAMKSSKLVAVALALAVLIGFGILVFLWGISRKSAKTVTDPPPRTDKAPLAKRLPFLGNFERCSWVSGVFRDYSRDLVPAPSSYYIRGYVVLEPAQTAHLLVQYQWAESSSEVIPEPTRPLGEGFPKIERPFWKSNDLIRSVPAAAEYSGGPILFQPKNHLLYFDLRIN